MKAHPLSRDQMVTTLDAYDGFTTADGAAAKNSVIDAKLIGANDYITGRSVLILEGNAINEIQPVTGFNSVTGEISTGPFSAQILEGTRFRVINLSVSGVGGTGSALAFGTFTTSSATVPADTGKAAFASQYFRGCLLVPLSGAVVGQPRLIRAFTTGTGVFTLDADMPFTAAPGLVSYAILPDFNSDHLPAADTVNNLDMNDVIGNKADASVYAVAATKSIIAYLKGVLGVSVVASGTFTTSSATVPADTGLAALASQYYKGCMLMPLTGACAFQPKLIVDFATGTGVFTLNGENPFTAAPGLVAYVVLSHQQALVPAADSTANQTTGHVVGNKSDAAVTTVGVVASLMAYEKGLLNQAAAIKAVTDAEETLTETGGTVTTDGTEQDVYIADAPAGLFNPIAVLIDGTNHTVTETVDVKTYYRIKAGGNYILQATQSVTLAVFAPTLMYVPLLPNRFGVKVTIQKTAGTNRAYDWEAIYGV